MLDTDPHMDTEHKIDSTISTVQLDVSAMIRDREADDSNNNPGSPIEQEKLDIDTRVTARLTQKPHDKYKFRKSIGRGGMKMVLQVKDMDTTRDVAMAVLPDAAARPRRDIMRFVQEARITASLEHPNIVPVHDIGVDSSGAPYFTMKLLRGETLASVLEKLDNGVPEYVEAYNLTRLLRIFLKICYAIAFAHSRGVLHLDLKPENVQIGDFGEVLIMDWGLARVVKNGSADSESDSGTESGEELENESRDIPSGAFATVDGVMKGTPGYMAPEQAAGRNSLKDCRTDIYALGAILYAMATCKSPIENKSIKEMIRDTLSGNIIPPRERTPEREIPSALEAVILKAMSTNPDNRYSSVKELRNEVFAFIGGFATVAERATFLKRTLLFFKRHSIILSFTAAILLILLCIGIYAVQEKMRQQGSWSCVYRQDFTRPEAAQGMRDLIFTNSMITERTSSWPITPEGLSMPLGEWLWLDLPVSGNTKLELSYHPGPAQEALEVCLSSRMEPLGQWWHVPTGYSFQFGGFSGTRDIIYRNLNELNSELITAMESKAKPGRVNTVTFIREGETLMIRAEDGTVLQATDLFPPTGKNLERIGIRSFANSMKLRSIALYRLALPEKASPLIAGDALSDVQLYEKAIEKYLMVADSYSQLPLSEMALTKAYMTAASKLPDSPLRTELIVDIKRRIAAKPAFKYQEQIMEIDALTLWREQRFHEALAYVSDLLSRNPDTGIVAKLLQLPHQKLPENVVQELLRCISRTRNLKRLDLSNYGIRSLSQLQGLPLTHLDCSGNELASLDGISSMPLETLDCKNNLLRDLKPLRGMRLKDLSCRNNLIEDVDTLKGMPLRDLDLSGNRIADLSPLAETYSLERLVCRKNQIRTLAPLADLRLKKLDVGENPLDSLEALRDMELTSLLIDRTEVHDLSPLKGMPLHTLELYNCDRLKDLSPVFQMPTLERLSLPPEPADIRPLRESASLKYLSKRSVAPYSADPPETAAEFWTRNPN